MITEGSSRAAAGKWIVKHSILMDGICGTPHLVERVSLKSVFYLNQRDELHKSALTSVAYVCDTEEEAKAIKEISDYQRREIKKKTDEVKLFCDGAIGQLMKQGQ